MHESTVRQGDLEKNTWPPRAGARDEVLLPASIASSMAAAAIRTERETQDTSDDRGRARRGAGVLSYDRIVELLKGAGGRYSRRKGEPKYREAMRIHPRFDSGALKQES